MNKTTIYVSEGHGFLWDAAAACALRSEHRIVGVLVGSLPRLPLQNSFFSLPVLLMPEEVTLLLEKELAVLVDDSDSHREPTGSEIEEYQATLAREETLRRQAYEENKRERAKARENNTVAHAQERKEENPPAIPTQELRKTRKTVQVPTSSAQYAWHEPKKMYSTLEQAKAGGLWSFPSTAEERLRYRIYVDLWDKGYYITPGSKFGGDFLLYPGDPLRYHSHFVASIVPFTKELSPVSLVGYGRLGAAVKKAYLLCSHDVSSQEFKYFCVEWTGM
ncbi:tRNA-intron endonuclease catalytic domain-like protein, partial [Basidiobolus meristosporus CBS 931.73]